MKMPQDLAGVCGNNARMKHMSARRTKKRFSAFLCASVVDFAFMMKKNAE
jgi:hypothetical protein